MKGYYKSQTISKTENKFSIDSALKGLRKVKMIYALKLKAIIWKDVYANYTKLPFHVVPLTVVLRVEKVKQEMSE